MANCLSAPALSSVAFPPEKHRGFFARSPSGSRSCWLHKRAIALASICVARTLDIWLSEVQELLAFVSQNTWRKVQVLKEAGYIADASVEAVKCSAHTLALINSACRSLWLIWSGDVSSQLKLCALPFSGALMFGPELETVLDCSADG